MLIGPEAWKIEKAPVEMHSLWEIVLYLGSAKKQSSISLSTAEGEYIAVANCCTQILWMKEALKDVNIETKQSITIFCDNTSAISLSNNPVMHSRTKHIPIKYHFLREQVAKHNIRLE